MEGNSTVGLAERRAAIDAARVAVRDLHTVLQLCPPADLGDLLGDIAELRAQCGAQLATITAAAIDSGLIEQSQYASPRAWVADNAWHSRREASTLAKTASLLHRSDLALLRDAVLTVDIDPFTAVVVAKEYDPVAPDLSELGRPLLLDALLDVGADHGPTGVRDLRQKMLAKSADDALIDYQDTCRRQIMLTFSHEVAPGVHSYELTVDNEGKAVLEAAIGPLSKPALDPMSGAADPRTPERRRGQALIEALRRSTVVTAANVGDGTPRTPKAVLHMTMALEDLRRSIGSGTVRGTLADGSLLAADTVRKLACDAGWCPPCSGPTTRSSTSGVGCAASALRSIERSRCGTGTARSAPVTPRRPGAMPII